MAPTKSLLMIVLKAHEILHESHAVSSLYHSSSSDRMSSYHFLSCIKAVSEENITYFVGLEGGTSFSCLLRYAVLWHNAF